MWECPTASNPYNGNLTAESYKLFKLVDNNGKIC